MRLQMPGRHHRHPTRMTESQRHWGAHHGAPRARRFPGSGSTGLIPLCLLALLLGLLTPVSRCFLAMPLATGAISQSSDAPAPPAPAAASVAGQTSATSRSLTSAPETGVRQERVSKSLMSSVQGILASGAGSTDSCEPSDTDHHATAPSSVSPAERGESILAANSILTLASPVLSVGSNWTKLTIPHGRLAFPPELPPP